MQNRWFKNFKKTPNPKIKLFCFPHAGGNSDTFKHWAQYLPDWIELYSLQLPGRGSRFNEPCLDNMEIITDKLSENITTLIDKPFVFLGHSLGGSIAFELTKKLKQLNLNLPNRLFIVGRESPRVPPKNAKYTASDSEIIEYLKLLSGTNNAVFHTNDLIKLLLPMIRCDLKLAETYHYYCKHKSPVTCPINVFWGTDDVGLKIQDVEDWNKETTSTCHIDQFEGHHFFLHETPKIVIEKMLAYIEI